MLDIAFTAGPDEPIIGAAPGVVAFPVSKPEGSASAAVVATSLPDDLRAEAEAFLAQVAHSGKAGEVHILHRPLQETSKVLFVGIGEGDEAGWRSAGAAVTRSSVKETSVTIEITSAREPAAAVRGFAEGAWLAEYKFRLVEPGPDDGPKLTGLRLHAPGVDQRAIDTARIVATHTRFARDLTNMPSGVKTPEWFVDQVTERGGRIEIKVWDPAELAADGFNGILAVGSGSSRGPRLLRLDYAPEGATRHVVLVGKGITFDTGGIDIKPADAMALMRKDMGGGAAVVGATLAAAELELPVRVTALVALAENLVSGTSWRQGDVIKHYGGLTTEVRSTDAEGRVVLGDALAYAVETYDPDYLIDLATLTGASRVALGKRIAALFSEDDALVKALSEAAKAAGESVWQLPLPGDYRAAVVSEIADLYNSTEVSAAGTITAALYLREFTGEQHDRWAHIDMSSPSWADSANGELAKGATGWGVRTLVRWFESL
ncbi:leucyl aminopeptidase [Allocatelliglobosispora scoriae]|uniref:Probable cytosol aminopeptidase n=1 Tax=Allocatelliglobosispora scoriae TaxID=643052 RepID=A0A841BXP6_9ACTN|nr:leucyl aminopeptidase family protein [Allocatelliglobosispora scoriae]MBB5871490.1 leucyl aminopeptidase [Allocatelliglobosispora scoriae]